MHCIFRPSQNYSFRIVEMSSLRLQAVLLAVGKMLCGPTFIAG